MRTSLACSFVLLMSLLSGSGCSCNKSAGEAPPCPNGTDLDGDHYGSGCPAGADCNDGDATIHDECCANGGIAAGCACDPAVAQPVSCFDGPPELPGVGPCAKGIRRCDANTSVWGVCDGQVLPAEEACNGADDDCDAQADEGVASACGNCLPGCTDIGVDTEPFPCMEQNPAIECDGVGVNPDGDLVLDSSTIENHFLWVANDREGTVSKIDTRTGYEVARYASVTHAAGRVRDYAGGRPFPLWNAGTAGGGYAQNRPSRTAVDFYGNTWVANRAFGFQPSITKFFNDTSDCVDANNDMIIQTSRDVDGDHRISLTNPAEFFGEADECIAMTVVVGSNDGWARALTIDAGQELEGQQNPGNPWVGMYQEQAFYQIDGLTGALMQRVPPTGNLQTALGGAAQTSYGAVVDGDGKLWAPSGCCGSAYLAWIDTTVNPSTFGRTAAPSGGGSYGITADLAGRIWLGGWPNNAAYRYNPANNTWTTVTISQAPGWGVRGVGIDTLGNVWGALHTSGFAGSRLVRINANTATVTGIYDMPNQVVPTGAGVDFDGNVWAINQTSSTASRLYIDPTTHEPANHPMTGNMVDSFPTGLNPYTYSDFTGLGLRTVTSPSGEYVVPLQGCTNGERATWVAVNWMATTPPGTRVEISMRAGDDLATLNQAPLFGAWTMSPADLQVPPGPVPPSKYALLIIRLISFDREHTPIVHSYNVQWSCPGGPIGKPTMHGLSVPAAAAR